MKSIADLRKAPQIKNLLDKGATMIDQERKRGAHDSRVAFIHPKSSSGVLIELVELSKGFV